MPHSENQIYILYRVIDSTEAIFDEAYLTFDLVAAMLFFIFSQGKTLFILYGILTLTLCGGDAFHLIPRIIRAVRGSNDKIKRQLGIGLQVSSITMTVFYILLMYIWKFTFPEFIHYQKCSFCNDRYRGNPSVYHFRKYLWIPYDQDGCGYYFKSVILDFMAKEQSGNRMDDR